MAKLESPKYSCLGRADLAMSLKWAPLKFSGAEISVVAGDTEQYAQEVLCFSG
jgi:hypothetical protein